MYQLIVYKVINFKIPRGDKMINKRYFQKVFTSDPVDKNQITTKYKELKARYVDWCYMINDIPTGSIDWYIEKQNEKSEKAYHDYILRGYK